MKYLERKSKQWFITGGILAFLVLLCIYVIIPFLIIKKPQNINAANVFEGTAIITAYYALFTVLGYYGLKRLAISAYAGNVLGLISMISIHYRDTTGWGDLIGAVTFMEISVISALLGAVIEMVYFILKKHKSKK